MERFLKESEYLIKINLSEDESFSLQTLLIDVIQKCYRTRERKILGLTKPQS